MSWSYEHSKGIVKGPVASDELVSLFRDGAIDGLTRVQEAGTDTWRAFGEVPELKQMVMAGAADYSDEDEDDDGDDDEEVQPGAPATAGHVAASATGGQPMGTVKPGPTPKMWFYAEAGGSQSGPAPTEAFGSLVAAGYVSGATLVWTAGMAGWTPLNDVPELAAQLNGDAATAASDGKVSSLSAAGAKRRRPADTADDADGAGLGGLGHGHGQGAAPRQAAAAGDGAGKKKRSRKGPSGPNTWVYVTGLPPDVTEDELEAHFKRAGMVRVDADTGGPKIKIYRQAPQADGAASGAHGSEPCKGDGSVCFVMPESVELAVELLDGVALREPLVHKEPPASSAAAGAGASAGATGSAASQDQEAAKAGWILHVEPASFDQAGGRGKDGAQKQARPKPPRDAAAGDNGGATGKTLTAAQRQARIRQMEQAVKLSWADEGDEAAPVSHAGLVGGSKGVSAADLRIVVLKHMFDPAEATSHPGGRDAFVEELRDDVGEELEAQCGDIEKMTIFPRHADGVILVKFATPGAAARCLTGMHGRFFGGRKIEVTFWDGVTDYSYREAADEEQARIDDFGKWLEEGDDSEPAS